jgi:hypothetical protein
VFPRIPENASLKASKTNQGWNVERPRSPAPDGKRLRFFFKTREKALEFAAKLKEQVNDHGANAWASLSEKSI